MLQRTLSRKHCNNTTMSELRHHNKTPLRRGLVLSHTPFLRPDARRRRLAGVPWRVTREEHPAPGGNGSTTTTCARVVGELRPRLRPLPGACYLRPIVLGQAPAPRRPIGRAPACARRLTPPCSADRAKSGPLRCSNFQPIGRCAQRLASGGNSAPTTRAQNIQLPLTGNRTG